MCETDNTSIDYKVLIFDPEKFSGKVINGERDREDAASVAVFWMNNISQRKLMPYPYPWVIQNSSALMNVTNAMNGLGESWKMM